jgi:hypothetical protein
MQQVFWQILDYFFIVFHTALIFFNLFGWLSKRTRMANFISLLLTGASWGLLGLFYGLGYCPLTDWHYQILHQLNMHNMPDSYILYLLQRMAGISVNKTLIDLFTLMFFLIALCCSVFFNFFKPKTEQVKLR